MQLYHEYAISLSTMFISIEILATASYAIFFIKQSTKLGHVTAAEVRHTRVTVAEGGLVDGFHQLNQRRQVRPSPSQ